MSEYYGRLKESLLDANTVSVTWELVPGRGAHEKAQEQLLLSAEKAAKGGKVHALTITDNPGGHPAISSELLAIEVAKLGIEPLTHFSCKDKNRNELEALLHGLEREGVHNLLIMTGDYTYTGYMGRPKPVFDVDATHLLNLITHMNNGLVIPTRTGAKTLAPAHFFAGGCVSPFKALESEVMTQYYKLEKKLVAGAEFIVSQLGYDARKCHELLLMMRRLGYGHIPLVGNVYVLSLPTARLMNQNRIPGCVVTDRLLAQIAEESAAPDKGKGKRIERAAKMYALLKGMGYAGVHIGGHGLKHEDVVTITEMGEQLTANWRDFIHEFDFPQPDGWYYFEKDPQTGLNTETPVDRSNQRPSKALGFVGFRMLHHTIFDPKGFLFSPMRAFCGAIDGTRWEEPFNRLEHLAKVVTNECRGCGDCAIFDLAYLCPMSQCPKSQRNGPCGGSYDGWCEVYPGKRQCVYVRAYDRLKSYAEEDTLGAYTVPPADANLSQTSSWVNFFMGRDHTAKRLGIQPPSKKKAPRNKPKA